MINSKITTNEYLFKFHDNWDYQHPNVALKKVISILHPYHYLITTNRFRTTRPKVRERERDVVICNIEDDCS